MTRSHLRLILLALGGGVLLYGAALLLRSEGRRSGGGEGFDIEPGVDVSVVRVLDGPRGDTVRLTRGADGWTINGYVADTAKVATLLPAIDSSRSAEPVGHNPGNHARLGVTDADGRFVEIRTGSDEPFAFYLGGRDLAAGGYYVRRADSDSVFRLEGPLGGYLGRAPDAWRVRAIARIDTATVREILIRRGEEELILARAETGWQMEGIAVDSTATGGVLRLLTDLSASGFPTDSAAAAVVFDAPDAVVRVFSEDTGDAIGRSLSLTLRLNAGPDEDSPWLVRAGENGEVVELSRIQINRLLPSREALLGEEDG